MRFLARVLLVLLALQACSVNDVVERERNRKEQVVGSMPKVAQQSLQHPDYLAYKQLCDSNLEKAKALYAGILASQVPHSVQTVLEPLNEIDFALDAAFSHASVYSNAHPDRAVRELADHCSQEILKFYTDLGLSRALFDAVKAVEPDVTDPETQRYVTLLLRDFRRNGVDKDEETRKKISALNDELVKIAQAFDTNINNSVRQIELDSAVDLDGLPEDYIAEHQPNANGKIVITTNYPDYQPFIRYAKSDAKRKALQSEYFNRAYPENEAVLKALLEKSYELARLLGYANYASYIVENKMIRTPANAHDFISRISQSAEKMSDQEKRLLLKRLQKIDPNAKAVESWQVSYLMERIRLEQYQLDSKRVREYFHYNKVRDGILNLMSHLFSVEIKPGAMSTWHADVEPYEVWENGQVIARFYLDMHPREGKYTHAAEFAWLNGIKGRQIPEAVLLCNFPNGLMEHNQVEVFLHEFGHLVHQIFAVSNHWVALSGIRNETDFVEAPSQMLEEWVWDAETLKTFASNAKGEVIPDELVRKMQRARYFGQGLGTRRQMLYAAMSLEFYDRKPTFDLNELKQKLIADYYPYNDHEGTHEYASFSHLGGYSAVYYSYMWSKVIALDMFSQFEAKGIMDPKTANHYRRTVLAQGSRKDAADLVHDFLGRPYNFKAFDRYMERIKQAQ